MDAVPFHHPAMFSVFREGEKQGLQVFYEEERENSIWVGKVWVGHLFVERKVTGMQTRALLAFLPDSPPRT